MFIYDEGKDIMPDGKLNSHTLWNVLYNDWVNLNLFCKKLPFLREFVGY